MSVGYRKLLILALLTAAAIPQAMAEEPVAAKSSSQITDAASAPGLPPAVLPSAVSSGQATGIPPLRNIDLLNKMEDERLPTSPRHFLKVRFKQVRKAKDQKILQLLLVCVGFVGAFVAILALRSIPPSRPQSS